MTRKQSTGTAFVVRLSGATRRNMNQKYVFF